MQTKKEFVFNFDKKVRKGEWLLYLRGREDHHWSLVCGGFTTETQVEAARKHFRCLTHPLKILDGSRYAFSARKAAGLVYE